MVYVLLGTGFEEMEALAPLDLLRRAQIPVMSVGLSGKTVYGSHKIGIEADITVEEMDLSKMKMLVLPGGLGGVASIRENTAAMAAIHYAQKEGKFLAAICAAPSILGQLGYADGKEVVCYPGFETKMGAAHVCKDRPAVRDGQLITGTSAGCATAFALELISALRGPEWAQQVANQIVIR